MHMHHARLALLCALLPLASCNKDEATAPAVLQGQLVLESFPYAAPEAVAVSSDGAQQAFSVGADGSFAMTLLAGSYRVYFRQVGTALDPGTRAALIYPRADGSIDREVTVVGPGSGFDLGAVRYLGELPDHFHVAIRAAQRRYHESEDGECEHGVDAHGEPCIDDHEGENECEDDHEGDDHEGDVQDDGGHEGESLDGGDEGEHEDGEHADDDPDGEDDHHVCVPEHSPPHHIGCDPDDDDIDGGEHEDEGVAQDDEGVGHEDEGPGHDGGVEDEGPHHD